MSMITSGELILGTLDVLRNIRDDLTRIIPDGSHEPSTDALRRAWNNTTTLIKQLEDEL